MRTLWTLQLALAVPAMAGGLPLAFEPNVGQAPPWVRYLARGPGYMVALTDGEVVLSFEKNGGRQQVRMKLAGADPRAPADPSERLPGRSHYFLGRDPSKWRTDVEQFARVSYSGVYPGISAAFYGSQGHLEYDFEIAPGADPNRIAIEFSGASAVRLDEGGDVVLPVGDGEARLRAPAIYQWIGGTRRVLRGRHRVQGNRVQFELGKYDPRYALVIDPVLTYSATLTGGRVGLRDLAVDAADNTWVTGCAASGFPMVSAYLDDFTTMDVVVTKLSADGTTTLYSTYLGGGCGAAIALDAQGNILVAGSATTQYFPVRHPAYSRQSGSFLAKLVPEGNELVYSTYLRGDTTDAVGGLAVDPAGHAYVTRMTAFPNLQPSLDLPPIPSPERDAARTAVIEKFTREGALAWSGVLGKGVAANAIAADETGAYIAGANCASPMTPGGIAAVPKECDAFVAKIEPDGAVAYSKSLGGSGWDGANNIALDAEGNAYITGTTYSADFPVTPGAPQASLKGLWDAFVAKLNAAGDRVLYATYLGGSREESAAGIAVDSAGRATVLGTTTSADFPLVNPLRPRRYGAPESIHVSDDAGRSWTGVAPHLRDYRPGRGSIIALAAAPSQPLTVYAAESLSVYRSLDGGTSWTTVFADPNQPAITGLAVHPSNPAAVYAATTAGIRYSTDGGATWTEREFTTTGAAREVNLVFSRSNPDVLYLFLRRATDPRILKSADNGQTWTNLAGDLPTGPQALAIDPTNENTLYLGANAGLFKSTDGGATWQELGATCVPDGPGVCPYQEIAVVPSNPRLLMFTRRGGRDYGYTNQQAELHRSLDGGQTWTASRLPVVADASALAIDPADPNIIYVGFAGTGASGGLYRTQDGGASWTSIGAASPFWTDSVNALAVLPLSPSRVLAATTAANEAFVATLDAGGSALVDSSFLGGAGGDSAYAVRSDAGGFWVLVGTSVQRLEHSSGGCEIVAEPPQIAAHFNGVPSRVQVRAPSGCDWNVESSAEWIAAASPAAGRGTGAVDLLIAPNTTGRPRTAEVFAGGQAVTVTQGGGPPCTLTPDLVRVMGSSSASDGFALTYTAGCRWQAVSNVPWITVGSGLGGPTSWVVPYTAQAHTGRTARQGTITITSGGGTATAVHTVLQAAAPCQVSVSGSPERLPAAGGTTTVQLVSEPADCAAWLADSGASWAAPLPGTVPAGIGNGSVSFRITPNTTLLERATRIQMGGLSVKITQDAVDCVYTLAPATQSVDSALFLSILNVYAPASCTWTAVSDSAWLRVTSVTPRTGTFPTGPTGNGRVYYRVEANNTGAERTGTISIAGRPFTVTQAAAPAP